MRSAVDMLLSEYRKFADERAQWEYERSTLIDQLQSTQQLLNDAKHTIDRLHTVEGQNKRYAALFATLSTASSSEISDIISRAKDIANTSELTAPFWTQYASNPNTVGKDKLKSLLEQMGYKRKNSQINRELKENKSNDSALVPPKNVTVQAIEESSTKPANFLEAGRLEQAFASKPSTIVFEDSNPSKNIDPSNTPDSEDVQTLPIRQILASKKAAEGVDLAALNDARNLESDEEEKFEKEVTIVFSKSGISEMDESNKSGKSKKTGTMVYKQIKQDAWKAKNALRSHLDGVRSVQFLTKCPGLLTGSEDGTMKLWNTENGNEVFNFYGHSSMVSSVLACEEENVCFSSGPDCKIFVWSIPSINTDPFGSLGHAMRQKQFCYEIHKDVIWDLQAQHDGKLKFSASADGSIGIWKVLNQVIKTAI